MTAINIPKRLEATRKVALRAIQPIRSADKNTKADKMFLFNAQRTNAGRNLPPYYLVYFLLVNLLAFRNTGQWEKVAWSVPIDFEGKVYLIEHRKMGLGIFAHSAKEEEVQASKIANLIKKGVKAATPFFKWLADKAVKDSKLNVMNKSSSLFDRFEYFLGMYRKVSKEAVERADEKHVEKKEYDGGSSTIIHMPATELRKNAEWLALSAIDTFFSWTEHVLIHIAILRGEVTTGLEVANLTGADWQVKFKKALDVNDHVTKKLFDKLVLIRRQLRNYMAHGAFGKRGKAFTFHSDAGAVPVLLPHQVGQHRFTLTGNLGFDEAAAIEVIGSFISHLWSGKREPAQIYIQESGLPLILPMANDGTYRNAMNSVEDMYQFVECMTHQFDRAVNMDW